MFTAEADLTAKPSSIIDGDETLDGSMPAYS